MTEQEQKAIIKSSESLIPVKIKKYHKCDIEGMDVLELLNKAQLNQFNVKFQGPTGAGKTTHYKAFCHKTKEVAN
jgi:MoxR-like ATPase